MRKIYLSLIAVPVAVLSTAAQANAACTIDQRAALAKAGYEKGEIEQLCAEAANSTPTVAGSAVGGAASPGGLELLNNGSIVGSNSADYAKRRCKIGEDGVWYKKKGLVRFADTRVSSKQSIDTGDREMLIVISLDTGFNSEFCLITRVDNWRYHKGEEARFNADADKYRVEYDAILGELRKRGVRFEQ